MTFALRGRMMIALAILIGCLLPATAESHPGAMLQGSGKTINLQLIVDSSGSMAAATDTGAIRMDSAKAVLSQVIAQIPDVEGVNVGFRVYGHRGNNTDAGRPESCASTELLVPMQGVDTNSLALQVESLQPVGWTPLGFSLQEAAKDFTEPASEDVINAIVMVTDGLETCDADPVAIASELHNSDLGLVVHVIGFGTTPEEQAILSGIAEQGGGELFSSANAGQLMSALFAILEELEVVEETGTGETRDSPLGIGRIGRVGDYELSVLSVTPNEPNAVSASTSGAAAPPGEQFFVARLSVTYIGTTSSTPPSAMSFQAVGARSVSYPTPGIICYIGDGSTSMILATELFEGGSAEYDVCWQIASEDADSLVMYVESTTDFDAAPVWFSLGNPIENTVNPDAPVDAEDEVEVTPEDQSAQDSTSNELAATNSSRTDPLPIGSVARVGDFELTVLSTTPNAADARSATSGDGSAPAGEQFFVARVSVTYLGTNSSTPASALNFQAVGQKGVSYPTPGIICYIGDSSTSIILGTEMFEGGSAEYDVCWQIASEDAESLVMYVESNTNFDAEPVWFSLQS